MNHTTKPQIFGRDWTMPETLYLPVPLQPVDYTIAELLDEHDAFTTQQISKMLFNSVHTCQKRLYLLYRLGFLMRYFRDSETEPIGWTPWTLSSRYVALQRNQQPPTRRKLERQLLRAWAGGRHRLTLHETNEFFVGLIAHARSNPDTQLTRWWSPNTISRKYGDTEFHAHGVWRGGEQETGFFYLPVTESLHWLDFTKPIPDQWTHSPEIKQVIAVRKALETHVRLTKEGGPAYPLLLVLRDERQETLFHQRIQSSDYSNVAATTDLARASSPADAIWKLVGGDSRCRIPDLPSSHGTAGTRNPGAPEESDNPLRALGQTRSEVNM